VASDHDLCPAIDFEEFSGGFLVDGFELYPALLITTSTRPDLSSVASRAPALGAEEARRGEIDGPEVGVAIVRCITAGSYLVEFERNTTI
jgi:hypothetical protein